jgi:hypothetical protein
VWNHTLPKSEDLFHIPEKSKAIEFTNCGKSRLTTEANPTSNKDSNPKIKTHKISKTKTNIQTPNLARPTKQIFK